MESLHFFINISLYLSYTINKHATIFILEQKYN